MGERLYLSSIPPLHARTASKLTRRAKGSVSPLRLIKAYKGLRKANEIRI
jgi:hypothetical protein